MFSLLIAWFPKMCALNTGMCKYCIRLGRYQIINSEHYQLGKKTAHVLFIVVIVCDICSLFVVRCTGSYLLSNVHVYEHLCENL